MSSCRSVPAPELPAPGHKGNRGPYYRMWYTCSGRKVDLPSGRVVMGRSLSRRRSAPATHELLPPVFDVVDEDRLAELVQPGVVGAAVVRLGQLLHEIHQIRVTRHHERGDRDAVAAAGDRLVERLVDDAGIEPEGVLV